MAHPAGPHSPWHFISAAIAAATVSSGHSAWPLMSESGARAAGGSWCQSVISLVRRRFCKASPTLVEGHVGRTWLACMGAALSGVHLQSVTSAPSHFVLTL